MTPQPRGSSPLCLCLVPALWGGEFPSFAAPSAGLCPPPSARLKSLSTPAPRLGQVNPLLRPLDPSPWARSWLVAVALGSVSAGLRGGVCAWPDPWWLWWPLAGRQAVRPSSVRGGCLALGLQ